MANNYCVYMHKNKINNKIYVGQTCNRKSRWSPISYKDSSYFYAAILKYGWENFEHIILKDFLTPEEADQWEIFYIEEFQTLNRQYGYNLKSGGTEGYQHSLITKEKIRKGNLIYYQNHTDEVLNHIKIIHENNKKKVVCINTNEIFDSQLDAAKYAGLKSSTSISRCCNGERKTAGRHPITKEKLKWKFLEIKERK